MNAVKLTLKLEKSAISKAKTYAKANRTSLSRLVESYFNEIPIVSKVSNKPKISPKVKALTGIIRDKNIDYKNELTTILSKKHGLS